MRSVCLEDLLVRMVDGAKAKNQLSEQRVNRINSGAAHSIGRDALLSNVRLVQLSLK